MEHSNASQEGKVLAYLKKGHSITPLQALSLFGCNRLAARIYRLRKDGNCIASCLIRVATRDGGEAKVSCYYLSNAWLCREGEAHVVRLAGKNTRCRCLDWDEFRRAYLDAAQGRLSMEEGE